jgi:hypothetical protein
VDVLSEDCKVVLTASQGQGVTSSTTDLGPACTVAKEYYAWLGDINVSPSCLLGASKKFVFYRAFYAACMDNDRTPSALPPPVDVVPLTYGQATLSNYLLMFVQVARCANVNATNIINPVKLLDNAIGEDSTLAGALATCASNPLLTSPSCIRVIYRLFVDGIPNTLEGGANPCECLSQSLTSLAALENSPLELQTVISGLCPLVTVYGAFNFVTEFYKGIAYLPRDPARTEPPFTQTSPIVQSILSALDIFDGDGIPEGLQASVARSAPRPPTRGSASPTMSTQLSHYIQLFMDWIIAGEGPLPKELQLAQEALMEIGARSNPHSRRG